MARLPRSLPRRALRPALRLSILDGIAFAFMVGIGESYLVADAVRLLASTVEQGLAVTLPLFIGALGPIVGLRFLARIPLRKVHVVGSVVSQSAVWFLLAWLDRAGGNDAVVLIALATLYQFFGQSSGASWTSWIGDLVPPRIRGRYFGRRNRWIYLSTCLGVLCGGALLERLEPAVGHVDSGRGFALLYLLAGLARLGSALCLWLTPEPPFAGLAPATRALGFLRTPRGTRAWRLLVFSGALYLSVYFASPYFTPFMLQTLGFAYWEYTLATLAIVVFKVLFVPAWGRLIDAHGAHPVFLLAAFLTAIVPLPWLWTDGVGWAVAAQCFSGLAWAGYEVALLALLFESSYRGTRPHVFALQSLLHGSGQLLGSLLGALALAHWSDLRLLFALSLGTRLALALAMPGLVPRPPPGKAPGKGELFLRVIGIRPSGGLAHRPVTDGGKRR